MSETAARTARPLWLETAAGPAFAMHHAPRGDARRCGVVLCNPFGLEALCTQRAYRKLAERLADDGFHALRLDYQGTGDSSGNDADPDRLAAWVASVRAATRWLRERAGVTEIALFGVRFGALVALATANEEEVSDLILLAPPKNGRIWLREIRAFQQMRKRRRTDAPAPDGEEAVGFLLSSGTIAALGTFDPAAVPGPGAKNALVIARDDLPGTEEGLVTALRARGTEATLSRTAGYGALVTDDPVKSVVPEALWTEATAWLAQRHPDRAHAVDAHIHPPSPEALVRDGESGPFVRERAVEMNGIFGIVSEPVDAPRFERPAILLQTIGANHRVGANRIYVPMARRWAALGFTVLRFDMSGIGDSPARNGVPEKHVYPAHAPQDAQTAMDWLERTVGCTRFVTVGLCSGAYVSFYTALADPRVVGLVLMNILTFKWHDGDSLEQRTRETFKSTRFYSQVAFERATWDRVFNGEVHAVAIAKALIRRLGARVVRRATEVVTREGEVARGFRSLLRRGTDVLGVFSDDDGGLDLIDTHLGVGAERFRHEARFAIRIIDGADHTFTPLWSQRRLSDLLTEHLEARFDAPPASLRMQASGPRSQRSPISPRAPSSQRTPISPRSAPPSQRPPPPSQRPPPSSQRGRPPS